MTSAAIAVAVSNKIQLFCWGNVSLGILVYYAGYIFNSFCLRFNKGFLALFCLTIIMSIQMFVPCQLDFCILRLAQGNIICDFIYGISSCILLWVLFGLISESAWMKAPFRAWTYLGEVSLVVFAAHRPILNYIIEPLLNKYEPRLPYVIYLMVAFVIVLVTTLVLNVIIQKKCPVLLGK